MLAYLVVPNCGVVPVKFANVAFLVVLLNVGI